MRSVLALGGVAGAIYGVLMAVFQGATDSFTDLVAHAALYGVPFGLFMGLFAGFMHRRAVRRDPLAVSPRVSETVELPVPAGEAMRLAARAAEAVPRAQTPEVRAGDGIVRFRVGMSWRSFGEGVVLRVAGDESRSSIAISSGPAVRTTLIDYGKSADNVRRLEAWLRKAAASRSRGGRAARPAPAPRMRSGRGARR